METMVPLSHLTGGRDNVRRTNPLIDIPVLAALIKSQGLLQNLLVRDNGDGKYRVIDGKRRRAAIRLLLDYISLYKKNADIKYRFSTETEIIVFNLQRMLTKMGYR